MELMHDHYTLRQLRSFGLTVGGVFLALGIWPVLWRAEDARSWAVVLGGSTLLAGLLAPALLRKPYELWMGLAQVLGWINTRIVLGIIFYAVFTPMAFL